MTTAEELGPGQQGHRRLGEQEDHHHVHQGGQAEGEGEPAHRTDRQHEQHNGCEQADGVGRQDGPPGPQPGRLDRDGQGATVPHLVPDPFEVDDERVGGDADRDDQTGHPGQAEPVALPPAEQQHQPVGDHRREHQAEDGDQPQGPVLGQRVEHDQDQADQPGQQAAPERLAAERGRDLRLGLHLERDRQGAVLELVGQRLGGLLAEVAGDLRVPPGDPVQGARG